MRILPGKWVKGDGRLPGARVVALLSVAAACLSAAMALSLGLMGGGVGSAAVRGLVTAGPAGKSGAPPTSFWGDVKAIPAAHDVLEFSIVNRTEGAYPNSKVYWSFDGQEKSLAQQHYFDMPVNSAGRMYFYLGSPASKYSDFIEFTVGPSSINIDTTRVVEWGLPLAILLHAHSGANQEIGDSYDVFTQSRTALFRKFRDTVPAPFKQLATVNAPYGISAPWTDPAFQPGGADAKYFTKYAAAHGAGSDTTADVFGCAGALASNPQLCAALNRHVAQLPLGQQTDSAYFYKAAPANYYAWFWHQHAINGLQYGFPYDDYGGQSSDISAANPTYAVVAVGF